MSNRDAPVTAVLGPTNTGKTHYAVERMLAHGDGMIGLPLRLLAREVYDRVVAAKGARAVALITGEEKIAPETARYFVCTVEAMPLDRRTAFLAVDEIQLARDPDRGHVFTDRILRARGTGETLLLGSDSMRPILRRMLPKLETQRRERLSTLSYAGPRKLTKLPRRTAIVAFSAEEVYAIAELMRRQRGGAAVVMGALSPRTRNAQVGLYQSGEVDFLVATDAIGMGLNMDVDHVAFASSTKFDGRRTRTLRPDEVAQIAGRAGRFRADGAFGETGGCPPLDEETIARVQAHEFEAVEAVEWRSPDLDFASLAGLLRSLEAPPPGPGLMRARGATDEETLRRLLLDPDLADRVRRPDEVRRAWEICCTPDFRKSTIDEHARLALHFAHHLLGPRRRLPQDLVAREIEKLDRTDGDLDALQARLAHIRTWTYAANRPDWIDDCEHWRGRTRAIEDRLSDTLHEVLTRRFIDRRTSALIRGLSRTEALDLVVGPEGDVSVEGHHVGRLEGLWFKPDVGAAEGREARAVRLAALRALAPEVARRLAAIAQAAHAEIGLASDGRLLWGGAAVARLAPNGAPLAPEVRLIGAEAADPALQKAAVGRLDAWLAAEIDAIAPGLRRLEALARDRAAPPGARGVAFQLLEAGGALDRRGAASAVQALTEADRTALRTAGVRLGRLSVFAGGLCGRPKTARLLATLRARPWLPGGVRKGRAIAVDPRLAWADYAAFGYRPAGPLAVRLDRLEALAARLAAASRGKDFALDPAVATIIGAEPAHLPAVLSALGYRRAGEQDGAERWRPPRPPARKPPAPPRAEGPFAVLVGLHGRNAKP